MSLQLFGNFNGLSALPPRNTRDRGGCGRIAKSAAPKASSDDLMLNCSGPDNWHSIICISRKVSGCWKEEVSDQRWLRREFVINCPRNGRQAGVGTQPIG